MKKRAAIDVLVVAVTTSLTRRKPATCLIELDCGHVRRMSMVRWHAKLRHDYVLGAAFVTCRRPHRRRSRFENVMNAIRIATRRTP